MAQEEDAASVGDSEQRRTGWGKSENKSARFALGNADRFKSDIPIWPGAQENYNNDAHRA